MSADTASLPSKLQDLPWNLLRRHLELGALWNSGLVRIVAVIAFYAIQTVWYFNQPEHTQALKTFQLQVTLICGVWVAGGVLLLSAIAYRQLPSGLRYLISISDVSLLTAAALCGTKAESQLIFAYPILIVLSVLCFEARLVALTTVLSIAGYMTLVGQLDERWFDAEHAVPVFTQVFIVTIS